MPLLWAGWQQVTLDLVGPKIAKKASLRRFHRLYRTFSEIEMVEAGGIEPPSANVSH